VKLVRDAEALRVPLEAGLTVGEVPVGALVHLERKDDVVVVRRERVEHREAVAETRRRRRVHQELRLDVVRLEGLVVPFAVHHAGGEKERVRLALAEFEAADASKAIKKVIQFSLSHVKLAWAAQRVRSV